MTDEIELHWIEKGQGEPLVLLHGNGEDVGYFRRQMDYFPRRYRVIAVDTRGHGQSPRGTAPFTFGTFARDLKNFLDRRGLSRVNLLGFSDGGNIALTFALKYPEYLRSLVLDGANLFPGGVRRRFQIPIILGYWAACLTARFDPKAVPKREMMALMVEQPNIDPKDLAAVAVPTLVIAGTQDMITEKHTKLIHQSIPGSRLVLLEGDHFIAAKNSAAFNRAVEEFLQAVEEPPQGGAYGAKI